MKAAVGDGILTFAWVFCASTLRASTHAIGSYLDILAVPFAPLILTTALVAFLVFFFSLIGNALGGAAFNPTGLAAFYAAGLGDNSLLSMSLRFPAQVRSTLSSPLPLKPGAPSHLLSILFAPYLPLFCRGCLCPSFLAVLQNNFTPSSY